MSLLASVTPIGHPTWSTRTMDLPDLFLTYVNTYYAVQEGLDRAVRDATAQPDDALLSFSRLANPFLWDGEASADRSIYEGFATDFAGRFGGRTSTPEDAYDFARSWLASLEQGRFGSGLVDAFDSVVDREGFARAFDAVRDQVLIRREIAERYPQDEPLPPADAEAGAEAEGPSGIVSATATDAAAIASLVFAGDDDRAEAADGYIRQQMRAGNLLQWLLVEEGTPVATAGLLTVALPPTAISDSRSVGLAVLCGGANQKVAQLLDAIRSQAADWGIDEVQEASLAR